MDSNLGNIAFAIPELFSVGENMPTGSGGKNKGKKGAVAFGN
jgi:hypothetical protein